MIELGETWVPRVMFAHVVASGDFVPDVRGQEANGVRSSALGDVVFVSEEYGGGESVCGFVDVDGRRGVADDVVDESGEGRPVGLLVVGVGCAMLKNAEVAFGVVSGDDGEVVRGESGVSGPVSVGGEFDGC